MDTVAEKQKTSQQKLLEIKEKMNEWSRKQQLQEVEEIIQPDCRLKTLHPRKIIKNIEKNLKKTG